MIDDFTISLDAKGFQKATERAFALSSRSAKEYFSEQVRGFIKRLIIITPPNKGHATGTLGKQRGEDAIKRDIRVVFRGRDKNPDAFTMNDIGTMMGENRRKGGSIRTAKRAVKLTANTAALKAYQQKKLKRVGYLASGWLTASSAFGKVTAPAWIARHSAPGRGKLTENDGVIEATITNAVPWASEVWGLRGRMQGALNGQVGAMNRRTIKYIQKLLDDNI